MHKKIALISVFLALQAHATPEGYAGRWDLKVIKPVSETTEKPIFSQSGHFSLEMISSEPTFWSSPIGFNASYKDSTYCHPEFLGGDDFKPSSDEGMNQFVKQAGGVKNVDKILKKDLGVSFSRFGLTWGIGPGDSGAEPCKSIGETTFYLTKDKKHVLIFKYPYIYRFDGGYGRIGSK